MAIATYRRVSREEQSRDTEAFERQGWQLSREAAKFPDRERLEFSDIQSGRRDDRPDFIRLVNAIESGQVEILIVTRIDRLSRDLEANARFQKQLQRKGVKVYEILRGDFLNWNNPNDWSYFCQAGLDGEKESRMLSARVKQTFEWQRSRGIMGGGRVGFPYMRDERGYIIPNPKEWELAIQCIKIVVENGGASMRSLGLIRELGLDRSRTWLSNWIRSPLLRGHTPINTRKDDGNRKPIKTFDCFPNTHVSLFSDPRLKGVEKRLDQIIEESNKYRGQVSNKKRYPLSGLVVCGRCGEPCHIRTVDKIYTYVMCGARSSRGIDCGGKYGIFKGQRRTVNTPYQSVETEVILELARQAEKLVNLAISEDIEVDHENPEVAKLRAQIDKLKQLDDTDLIDAIAKKTAQLNRLLLKDKTESKIPEELKQDFIRLFRSSARVHYLSRDEKQSLFKAWIFRVTVDKEQINVMTILDF